MSKDIGITLTRILLAKQVEGRRVIHKKLLSMLAIANLKLLPVRTVEPATDF